MIKTKNQKSRWRVHEFSVPFRLYELEYNKITIHGNIVRVYSNEWYYRAVILENEPVAASWKDEDLLVTFHDGTTSVFSDDGCWDSEYIGQQLKIEGTDILISNSAGKQLIIHNEQPVIKTYWCVYGGRHVVWVGLAKEGRYFSAPGFFEHAATPREILESTQALCEELNAKFNLNREQNPNPTDQEVV